MNHHFQTLLHNLQSTGKYWIVFTGDSITSCEWVHPNWRDIVIYVLYKEATDQLGGDWKTAEWGIRGFNHAYDGATTRDIVERLDDVLLVRPQLLIGLMGGNDPALGVSVDESLQNISKITEGAIAGEAEVVWCNSTSAGNGSKKNDEYEPYARAFMQLPNRPGLTKIDMFSKYQAFPTENFFTFESEENPVEGIAAGELDLQHPNQLGNAYIAKVILSEVFGIAFDPEKYNATNVNGAKYPEY